MFLLCMLSGSVCLLQGCTVKRQQQTLYFWPGVVLDGQVEVPKGVWLFGDRLENVMCCRYLKSLITSRYLHQCCVFFVLCSVLEDIQ